MVDLNHRNAQLFQHTAARRRLGISADVLNLAEMFQHTAARRRLGPKPSNSAVNSRFNTQPPEGGWRHLCMPFLRLRLVSTHSRPKAAGPAQSDVCETRGVSTHSRPKAAGIGFECGCPVQQCFNTQPPEGGWEASCRRHTGHGGFNTQPPEGGWV